MIWITDISKLNGLIANLNYGIVQVYRNVIGENFENKKSLIISSVVYLCIPAKAFFKGDECFGSFYSFYFLQFIV